MQTVVFDLDGTLADTSGDLIAAANAVFDALGHGTILDPIDDDGLALRGGRAMLTEGHRRLGAKLSEKQMASQYANLLEAYRHGLSERTKFYPGAIDAVEQLRAKGYRTSICTNKPVVLAEQLMRELGGLELFDSLIGAGSLPTVKPDPEPLFRAVSDAGGTLSSSVLVGDTATDRDAAKNAGVASILVTFSPAGDSVKELLPEAVIDHYDELAGVVSALIGTPFP